MYVCMYVYICTSVCYPPEKYLTHFSLTNIAGNHTLSGKCCMHWPIFLSSSTVFFQRRRPFLKERCTFWRSLWTYYWNCCGFLLLNWWYAAWRSTAHSSRTVSLLWRVFPTVSVVSATPSWKNIVVTIQHCGLSNKYTFIQLYYFKRAMRPFKKNILK